ncbi:MAG: hypothetical protein ABF576_12500 [Gluconobacter japonicus]
MMNTMSQRFSPEVRERAARMVGEHLADYGSEWAEMTSIAAFAELEESALATQYPAIA